MGESRYAPIVLFTYNRLNHTKKTVDALRKNELASKTELYVFSDAPKIEKDKKAVQEVRNYLETIKGFKKIHIIKRDKNYGVANNLIEGITRVVNKKEKVIMVEDDDLVTKYFLNYMNDALNLYKNEKKVGAICGFTPYFKSEMPETFFLNFFNSWSWGIWKDRWILFEKDGKKLLSEIQKNKLDESFNVNNTYPFIRMLKNQIKGFNDSWAIRLYASLFLSKKLILYPKKSLVENIGFDNTGIHCEGKNYAKTIVSRKKIKVEKIPLAQNKKAYKNLQRYFKGLFWSRLIQKLKRMIKNPIKEIKKI